MRRASTAAFGLSPCGERSYGRGPSLRNALVSTYITPMQVYITPMQVYITPLQVYITPLQICMGPMSIDTTPMSTDITPLQIYIAPMSTDITPPSIDRTLLQTVLPAFASRRSSSGAEPGRGFTASGRPEAGKWCSLPYHLTRRVTRGPSLPQLPGA